ncbi:methylated-DNA--[protein]-cysteine S-methyltransferase [Paenibacillus psychroresistens]|uniref:Methylated-DNA--protein-cysteine methyltransferase n=1 Tax=Paenibacillus psychroresistens TaxID=1778678 RepID=A0A6B8RSQ5_9BACL|nr:methylated-DNA--[protein]-cysteine S-methyltransferase [Paenibacillus psychroresistens]QGQ98595.1 methylated-DNA--[protein]-cysteine S-methyltransferase [Paenibacillus psychroresistens]
MNNIIYYDEIATPIGPLTLCATENGLCHLEFSGFADAADTLRVWSIKHMKRDQFVRDAAALSEVVNQLKQYFSGSRHSFDLTLDMQGTPFQRAVWQALQTIPYGETNSYKSIGEKIGQPKAVRAVGGANNRNPIPIIVPCHRVIGANGAMVGFGGGLPVKHFLLDHETQHTKELQSQ